MDTHEGGGSFTHSGTQPRSQGLFPGLGAGRGGAGRGGAGGRVLPIVDTKRKLFTETLFAFLHFVAPDTTMMARSKTTMVLDKTS